MKRFMGKSFSIHRLAFGGTTTEGAYYAKVEGSNVGHDGRVFWHKPSEAEACARRFILATEQPNDQ